MVTPFDTVISGSSNCPNYGSSTIRVEFYGIPRVRAGLAEVQLPRVSSLGELLGELVRRFPQLADGCVDKVGLSESCIANLDGKRFVRDPTTPLSGVTAVLILSADSGG